MDFHDKGCLCVYISTYLARCFLAQHITTTRRVSYGHGETKTKCGIRRRMTRLENALVRNPGVGGWLSGLSWENQICIYFIYLPYVEFVGT